MNAYPCIEIKCNGPNQLYMLTLKRSAADVVGLRVGTAWTLRGAKRKGNRYIKKHYGEVLATITGENS